MKMTKDEWIGLIISMKLCDAYAECVTEYPAITALEFSKHVLLETLRLYKNTDDLENK